MSLLGLKKKVSKVHVIKKLSTMNYFVIINVGHTSIMRIVILKHINVQDKILNVFIKHSVIGIVCLEL